MATASEGDLVASPSYDFSGARVLVTGGTRGLGHLVARSFARGGAAVIVTGTQSLTSFYDADLTGFGYHRMDLVDGDSIAEVADTLGPVDVVVNAAAPRLPSDLDPAEREFVIHAAKVGLLGPLQLATRLRLRLSDSTATGGGSVVNLPTVKRWFDLTHGPLAADLEMERATARLASAWSRLGVRVNSVTAEPVIPVQRPGFSVRIEQGSGPLLTRTRAGTRTTTLQEISDVALFLASSGARAVTGQTLNVGGSTSTSQ